MTPAARLSAAIDVLTDVDTNRRPVQDALKAWGLAHRFAGSGDRVAIGNLVFDTLRRRASLAWRMGSDAPRAVVLAAFHVIWGHSLDDIDRRFAMEAHAPSPLTEAERRALSADTLADAPDWVRADVPEWLAPSLVRAFGPAMVAEGAALAGRAPVDLRVNTLRADRDKVLAALADLDAVAGGLSPVSVRVPVGEGPAKPPHVQSELAFSRGWFEVQNEGSQVAALLAGVRPGQQVLDLCAGAGGKTLALAAVMDNRGQLYAYDSDKRRFGDILERINRSGAHNIQVRQPGRGDVLADLEGRMDVVFVDAPCTGTGTWRRRPDAKWRVGQNALALRMRQQDEVLEAAVRFVRSGGRLIYVTCSVLPEENEDRVAAFLSAHPDFRLIDPAGAWVSGLGAAMPPAVAVEVGSFGRAVRMTPATADTDGFFVALIERSELRRRPGKGA